MQNLPTNPVSVGNREILGLGYTWNQINDTWVSAVYTWNNVIQQTSPAGIAVDNKPVSNVTITNI